MAAVSGKSRHAGWPLQAYFAVLGLAVVLVGAGAGAFVYVQAGTDAEESATADAGFAAHKAADQLNSSLKFISGALGPIASAPSTPALFASPSKCVLGYAPLNGFDTGHIDIVRPDGSIVCSSRNPLAPGKP